MSGQGTPAQAFRADTGAIREFTADTFEPSPLEAESFGEHDRVTPALIRLIQDHRSRNRTVAVLSRKRRGRWSVNLNGDKTSFAEFGKYGSYLCSLMQIEEPDEVRFSSTHGFKGQEADAVILLNVTQRNYPLIHPTWALFQVFGDTVPSLTEAERRLFYVGVSRSRLHLDVVTTVRDPSEFWIASRTPSVSPGVWDRLHETRLADNGDRIELRVYNSQVENFDESRVQLKAAGFRFPAGTAKYWWLLIDEAEYDEDRVVAANWAKQPGIRLEAWHDGRRILDHGVSGGRPSWPAF